MRGTTGAPGCMAYRWRIAPRCAPLASPRSNVHEGFYDSYLSMAQQMQSAVDGLGGTGGPDIFASGHSLGAAIANLAAFELTLAGYPVAALINFGQPRVGDPTYAACFASAVGGTATSAPINWRAFQRAATAATALPVQLDAAHMSPLQREAVSNATMSVSPLLLRALERAMAHPANAAAMAKATAAEWTRLRALMAEWSHTSVAVARKQVPKSHLLAHARALTPAQVRMLASLSLPLRERSSEQLRGAAAGNGTGARLGSGAIVYRVIHNADIVPHLPPQSFGFQHAPTEIW